MRGSRRALLVALLAAGCGGSGVTDLRVVARFDEALGIDQLRYEGWSDAGGVSPGAVRPAAPGGSLADGSDVAIVLDDKLAGTRFDLVVVGLRGGVEVARGARPASPLLH